MRRFAVRDLECRRLGLAIIDVESSLASEPAPHPRRESVPGRQSSFPDSRRTFVPYWSNMPFSTASLGSSHRATHSQAVVFRLPPHTAQSPRQSVRQSGFIGNAS